MFITSDSCGCSFCKAPLQVLSLLSFDIFDFPVPRCFSFCMFFSFDGCYFFSSHLKHRRRRLYIYIYFNVRLWARRGFPGLGLNSLKECAHTFRGPFFSCDASRLGLDEDRVTCPETKPSEIRRHTSTPTGHMSGGKHLQSRFCKRHICFSASRLQ